MVEWMVGWPDGRMDEWTDGQMVGRMKGQTFLNFPPPAGYAVGVLYVVGVLG